MGKNSSIEWTHHTFNPWWGCSKVSEACENCYAEAWSKRMGANVWGVNEKRKFFSKNHWHAPIQWNNEAHSKKKRSRVFCASMADVFESRFDLSFWRVRLWKLIQETPWLDWLLLTKRPENILEMTPWKTDWPNNVWIGVTVENQKCAKRRLPALLENPAVIRFVSCEPLLAKVDLSKWIESVDWVIVGGESGAKARPTNPVWVRYIRDQCLDNGIPFFFKQWGTWRPSEFGGPSKAKFNSFIFNDGSKSCFTRCSKKVAGKDLDGRYWNEIPGPKIISISSCQ